MCVLESVHFGYTVCACLPTYTAACLLNPAHIILLGHNFILTFSEQKAPLNSFSSQDLSELKMTSAQCGYVVQTQARVYVQHACTHVHACTRAHTHCAFRVLGFSMASLA